MPKTNRIYCTAEISLLESAMVVSRYESQILSRTIEQSRNNQNHIDRPLLVTSDPMPMSSIPESMLPSSMNSAEAELSLSLVPQISRNPDYSPAPSTSSSGQHSVFDTTPELDDSAVDTDPESPVFTRRNLFRLDSSSSSSTEDEILSQYSQENPNIRTR